MKKMLASVTVACALNMSANADCLPPQAPSKVPDGARASEQEMLTAMQTLKQYNGDVETYLKCLEFESRQNRLAKTDEEKLHNAAVETMSRIAARFNEQVRTYKAKSG